MGIMHVRLWPTYSDGGDGVVGDEHEGLVQLGAVAALVRHEAVVDVPNVEVHALANQTHHTQTEESEPLETLSETLLNAPIVLAPPDHPLRSSAMPASVTSMLRKGDYVIVSPR